MMIFILTRSRDRKVASLYPAAAKLNVCCGPAAYHIERPVCSQKSTRGRGSYQMALSAARLIIPFGKSQVDRVPVFSPSQDPSAVCVILSWIQPEGTHNSHTLKEEEDGGGLPAKLWKRNQEGLDLNS
jgi:hypothetical protein